MVGKIGNSTNFGFWTIKGLKKFHITWSGSHEGELTEE
jgi:hypothetical protein